MVDIISKEELERAFDSRFPAETKAKLADGLAVTNATRCIAESNGKLYACWQFECERDGRQYYVFIDSASGAEVDIFKVIKNTEGHTVM